MASLAIGVIGVDSLMRLTTMAQDLHQLQIHGHYLSGKVHAAQTRSTDTAADAALIILDARVTRFDSLIVALAPGPVTV